MLMFTESFLRSNKATKQRVIQRLYAGFEPCLLRRNNSERPTTRTHSVYIISFGISTHSNYSIIQVHHRFSMVAEGRRSQHTIHCPACILKPSRIHSARSDTGANIGSGVVEFGGASTAPEEHDDILGAFWTPEVEMCDEEENSAAWRGLYTGRSQSLSCTWSECAE